MPGGKVEFFFKDEKKSSSRPFSAHPAGGQETIFYLRMAPSLSLCLSVCPHVCLSVCPHVCLSVCPHVCPYVCLSVPMSVPISVCLSPFMPDVSLSVCLSPCLSPCLFVCLSLCLFVCLSVCLSLCLVLFLSQCLSIPLSVCLSLCMSVCPYVCLCLPTQTYPLNPHALPTHFNSTLILYPHTSPTAPIYFTVSLHLPISTPTYFTHPHRVLTNVLTTHRKLLPLDINILNWT